jgi:MFS family permease
VSTVVHVPRRVVGTVALGTLLNPLNSSMIAVALVRLRSEFDVTTATVLWLVSAFYLAAALGQPLMGRMADLIGAKRIFCSGWVIVGVSGALTPLSPSFEWLVVGRVVQAFGTSAAYGAGVSLIRRSTGDPLGPPPSGALGTLSITSSISAAIGPVLGGVLIALAGWQAIFLVNTAMAVIGLPLALRFLPSDGRRRSGAFAILRVVDWPGILLFVGALGGLLGLLASLATDPLWGLAPPVVACTFLLVAHERRAKTPIVDLKVVGNARIAVIFALYALVNVVFYTILFGLPQWLEEVRGYAPEQAGLFLLPLAGIGIVVTPIASRVIARRGFPTALLIGATGIAVGSLALGTLGATTPVWGIAVAAALLGIPSGFNQLGLLSALYKRAAPESMGAAAGLFQTSRYVGSTLAMALIAVVVGDMMTTAALHHLAFVTGGIGAVLIVIHAGGWRQRVDASPPDDRPPASPPDVA